MAQRPAFAFLATLIASVVVAPAVAATGFPDYPGEPLFQGAPVKPRLSTPKARLYRTALRRESAQGPNFNGHYRLATWGCGSSCLELAVVDLTNGRVWFAATEYCAAARSEGQGKPVWIDARIDSRLFYRYDCQMTKETACPDDAPNRRHAYVWTHEGVKSLGAECVPETGP